MTPAPGQQNIDILQEVLRQQQAFRLQQQAAAPQLGPPVALGAPLPPLGDNLPADIQAGLPQAPAPGLPLNALQTWQLQWQQHQQQQLQHLQPFLAEPANPRQARTAGILVPPGAVQD